MKCKIKCTTGDKDFPFKGCWAYFKKSKMILNNNYAFNPIRNLEVVKDSTKYREFHTEDGFYTTNLYIQPKFYRRVFVYELKIGKTYFSFCIPSLKKFKTLVEAYNYYKND